MTTEEAWAARQRLISGETGATVAADLRIPVADLRRLIAQAVEIPAFILFASLGGRACQHSTVGN